MGFKERFTAARHATSGFGERHVIIFRTLFLLASLLFAYFFIEFPFNPAFLVSIDPIFVPANLAILALIFAFVYLVGQQSRISIFLFQLFCLVIGMANHYVMDFKGTPVIPSDMFALGTAAEVAGGYALTPDPQVIFAVLVFILYTVFLFGFVPKVSVSKRKLVVHMVLAFLLAITCAYNFLNNDLRKSTGIYIYAFHIDQSYMGQGTSLCFLALGQSMLVKEPDGYNAEDVADAADAALADYEAEHTDFNNERPTVVCIMNESFVDFGIFDELKDVDEARPKNFYNIAAESVMAGYSYASGFGASTCNSEFEFLTGSSMAFCGGGSYPYMYYDLSKAGNMARYFADQGYDTTAIHPAEGSNWNRVKVYRDLGFQKFLTVDDFPNADLIRNKTRDKDTYKRVLEEIDNNATPQFIFDVTYANHGGYVSHLIDGDLYVRAKVNGQEIDYLNEYLSLIQVADKDLKWFIDELKKRKDPVIVCFYGDHAPNFVNKICGGDDSLSGSDRVNQSEKRYTTPYFIWANYPVKAPEIANDKIAKLVQKSTTTGYSTEPRLSGCKNSTNFTFGYLSTAVIETTGLPMDERTAYLAKLRKELPLVNSIGFMDKKGDWHRHSEGYSDSVAKVIDKYQKFQYWNLFDANRK